MIEHITKHSRENAIRMLLQDPSYSNVIIVLLEGQADVKLFRSILNEKTAKLRSCKGKDEVIDIVSQFSKATNVVGICDADFDHILETLNPVNIFITDTHDIETMTIASPAFDHILSEFVASDDTLQQLQSSLLDQVLGVCSQIGYLRFANAVESLELDFQGIRMKKFLNIKKAPISIDIKIDDFIGAIINRSSTKLTNDTLKQKYDKYSQQAHDPFQLCNGHDICEVISHVLSLPKITSTKDMNTERIESSLRLSYVSGRHYADTELYRALSGWQSGRLV